MRSILILSLLAACGSNGSSVDHDSFPTFQACYDEHHMTESFPPQMAIEICCIDHPIGSAAMNTVCGDTALTCSGYVTQNLMDPNDPMLANDITAACNKYIVDRSM